MKSHASTFTDDDFSSHNPRGRRKQCPDRIYVHEPHPWFEAEQMTTWRTATTIARSCAGVSADRGIQETR